MFTEVDVCDVPEDRQVWPGFNVANKDYECLPDGFCLADGDCYYPRNHMYGKRIKRLLLSQKSYNGEIIKRLLLPLLFGKRIKRLLLSQKLYVR